MIHRPLARSLFATIAAAAVAVLCQGGAQAQVLYTTNFDTDTTSAWTFNSSIAGDTASNNNGGEANFFFDYSTVGIPSAPNSVGGTTRGLKLEANVPGTGIFSGISVSPNGQSFTGSYVLRMDVWQNFNGPFPVGGSGSTQITHAGIGANGSTVQFPGSSSMQSVLVGATADGNSANDYRLYTAAGAPRSDTSGVYAAGSTSGSTNNSNTYYNTFTSKMAPAAQLALFPQQTGSTATGTQGMGWHTWVITKNDNLITWEIDTKLIASLDITGVTLGGSNIFLGQFDITAGSSTDPNARNLLFGLMDNVSVSAVPEPSTWALIIGGLGVLLVCRRRHRSAIRS